jgi:hypothetical protein
MCTGLSGSNVEVQPVCIVLLSHPTLTRCGERWWMKTVQMRALLEWPFSSFGIVLWGIWTRDLPFRHYLSGHAVADAVERGERPPVPERCPAHYVKAMRYCWDQNRRKRPSFDRIVARLEQLVDGVILNFHIIFNTALRNSSYTAVSSCSIVQLL